MGEAYLYITCLFKHSSYYSTMPKYFCDYCDTHLTHNSPSVRKTHCGGRKHKDNVRMYYQNWVEEQAQHVIDAATKAYKAGKIAPFPGGPTIGPHSLSNSVANISERNVATPLSLIK